MSCFERLSWFREEAEIPRFVVRLCSVSSEKGSQRSAEPRCVLLKIQARKNMNSMGKRRKLKNLQYGEISPFV